MMAGLLQGPATGWRLWPLVLALLAVGGADPNPIRNVIVLMEENRSFDHLLGWMTSKDPRIDGLRGTESNPMNSSQPGSKRVFVGQTSPDEGSFDPCHDFECVTFQIFGINDTPVNASMQGFVETAVSLGDEPAAEVMNMWEPNNVPVITTLASEFAVFDRWFSSVPGPTNPNRRFLHATTAEGSFDDSDYYPKGFTARTIFDEMLSKNRTWGVYYFDWSPLCMYESLRKPEALAHFYNMSVFYAQAASGSLPEYAFIVPRMFPTDQEPANDQHPDHSVLEGERLIRDVYQSVRASPQWNHSLLLITYDEHGGYYDHVSPPSGVPNPDGLVSRFPYFNWTRLGVRVPTVMISPWIEKGTVVHEPPAAQRPSPDSEYEHSSVIATLRKLLNLGGAPLTARERWAATFEHVLSARDAPRVDCPSTLPALPPIDQAAAARALSKPPNDLQRDFLRQANTCNPPEADESYPSEFATQREAGQHIRLRFQRMLDAAALSR